MIWQLIRSKTRDFAQRGLQLSFPLSLFIRNAFEYFSAHQNSTREHKCAAVNWKSIQRTCKEQVFLFWWRPSALSARSTVNASKDSISPLDVYIESIFPKREFFLSVSTPDSGFVSMAALQLREVIFQVGRSSVSGVFYPVPNHPFLPWATLDDQPQTKVRIFWHFNLQTTSRVSTYDGSILRNKYLRTTVNILGIAQ